MAKKSTSGIKIISTNRKASYNYFLSEFLECGIALKGTEIKSLRVSGCNINDAYIVIHNGEAEIINMHIPAYKQGNIFNHDPLRNRVLLLHKREIRKLAMMVKQGGYTIVPTKIYLKKGRAKVEIALAKGKKLYDKRDSIKDRDNKRYIAGTIKEFNN